MAGERYQMNIGGRCDTINDATDPIVQDLQIYPLVDTQSFMEVEKGPVVMWDNQYCSSSYIGIQGFASDRGVVHLHQEAPDVTEVYFPLTGTGYYFLQDPDQPQTKPHGRIMTGPLQREQVRSATLNFITDEKGNTALEATVDGEIHTIPGIALPPHLRHGTMAYYGHPEEYPLFLALKIKPIPEEG